MRLQPFSYIVLYQMIVVYLPNTSSQSSSSTSASSSSSRSNMQNPCPGRGRSSSGGLSVGDTQFLSTSLWKTCLQECNLSPMEEADALVQLVTQTNELKQTFGHFKERFAQRVFRSDYNSISEAYAHLVFRWLIPLSSNISLSSHSNNPQTIQNSWNQYQVSDPISVLLAGYDIFQRVAIAVETVLGDMTDQGRNDYRRRYGRWWRQAVGRSNRIIQSIYLNLRSRNTPNIDIQQLSTHSRNLISESVRCIDPDSQGTRRNMRDLAILRNAIAITDHFRHMFVLYAEHRINHLLSQANSGQQERRSRSVRHNHGKNHLRSKHRYKRRKQETRGIHNKPRKTIHRRKLRKRSKHKRKVFRSIKTITW